MKKIILIIALISSGSFFSQEDSNSDSSDIDDFYMDFSISKVTAFSLLNVEPSNILKPGTIKEFAMGVGSYVDLNGNFKPGLAMEWAPFMTFNNNNADSWNKQFLWRNLLISGATSGDSLGGKAALAFRWSPLDRTNPLQNDMAHKHINNLVEKYRKNEYGDQADLALGNFTNAYYNVFDEEIEKKYGNRLQIFDSSIRDSLLKKWKVEHGSHMQCELAEMYLLELKLLLPSSMYQTDLNSLTELSEKAAVLILAELDDQLYISDAFSNELIKFKTEFKNTHWNKMALEVGGGQIFYSQNAKLLELAANYNTFYLSFATPLMWDKKKNNKCFSYNKFGEILRDNSQVIFQLRMQNYYAPDSTQNNSLFAGTRLLYGKSDWHISLECGYMSQANFVTGLDQSYLQYALGWDYRISEGNWIEFALGGTRTFSNSGRVELSLLPRIAFRHAFQKESRFD